jgi:hypothetical protein
MKDETFTYRHIKEILDKMTPEQLDQEPQIMISQVDHDKPFPLHPVISFKTVHELVCAPESDEECDTTRSAVDNEHHPEQFVFLADYNMFAEDGTICFDLFSGERIYSKHGKKDVEVEDEFGETFGDCAGEDQ